MTQPPYDPNQPQPQPQPPVSGPPYPQQPYPPQEPVQPPSRRHGLLVGLIAAGVVLVALVVGGILFAGGVLGPDKFAQAQSSCDEASSGTAVRDDGDTLIINGAGTDDTTGVEPDALKCLINELGAPTAVQEHMFDTRALDGRQQGSWDGFTASWSYHPDNGLDLIVRKA
jgi:hypothetical protein